jgi:hypothetical protein
MSTLKLLWDLTKNLQSINMILHIKQMGEVDPSQPYRSLLGTVPAYRQASVNGSRSGFGRVSQIAEENCRNLLKKRASPPLGSSFEYLRKLATSRNAL